MRRQLLVTLSALCVVACAKKRGTTADGASDPILVIDRFEDGDLASDVGLGWVALSDASMGGRSSALLELTTADARGTASLRLSGTEVRGPRGSFALASVPIEPRGRAVSLAGFRSIRFWARGAPATVRVGIRSAGVMFASNVEIGARWKQYQVELAPLALYFPPAPPTLIDLDQVSMLFFGNVDPGAFDVAFDDIELVGATGYTLSPTPGSEQVRLRLGSKSVAGLEPIATDPEGDGKLPGLADIREVALGYDRDGEGLWFRLGLRDKVPAMGFGLNLAFDNDGDPNNGMAWWGSNTEFKFDRLVTVWLSRSGDHHQGTVAIADSADTAAGSLGVTGDVGVWLDPSGDAVIVKVARELVAGERSLRFVAATGSPLVHNDDLPNSGAIEHDL